MGGKNTLKDRRRYKSKYLDVYKVQKRRYASKHSSNKIYKDSSVMLMKSLLLMVSKRMLLINQGFYA